MKSVGVVKHFISMLDLSRDEISYLLNLSKDLKDRRKRGERIVSVLKDKHIAVLFEKPSTRTRISFDVAIRELGGNPLILYSSELQLARGETIPDTARVLSRYVDGIVARVKKHDSLVEMSKFSSVPVINALSDKEHPVQILSDLFTITEFKGELRDIKISFVGDGQDNVLYSLMLAAGIVGLNLYIASPKKLWPEEYYLETTRKLMEKSGGQLLITEDPVEAVKDADVIYTDVWVSMGQESDREWRVKLLSPYQVNSALVEHAKNDYIFMHCLPAHRGEEVTDEIIDGKNSVVWDQAENRLHTQKALLYYLYW